MTSAGPAFNAAQWLGLNYVMAYLFLDIRKAVMTTIVVLLLTLIGHYMAIAEYRTLDDSLGIVANMGVAHAVFVVLLWTVIKMRISAAELNERMRLLEQHSAIDPLTRISNRRGLESMLQQLEKQPPPLFAMLLIDIDYFKSINDLYGHVKGDTVLAGIAETLKTAIDSTDQLGRWGGEEFLLVTRCENHQQAYRLADKLRRLVEAQPYLSYRKVTISVGISYSDQADSMQALFEMADKNLYIAKKQGRNRVINSGHTADTEPMI
jgi:diguanylate cyclase (GGDEF)-like protein